MKTTWKAWAKLNYEDCRIARRDNFQGLLDWPTSSHSASMEA